MAIHIQRREFIVTLGSAVAWPLAVQAQPQMPVIGFLNSASPDAFSVFVNAFHEGLEQAGFIEGQNVRIEYRWAYGNIINSRRSPSIWRADK